MPLNKTYLKVTSTAAAREVTMQLPTHEEEITLAIKQVEILHQYSLQVESNKRYLIDLLISQKLSELSAGVDLNNKH